MPKLVLTEEDKIALTSIVKHFEDEDRSTRDRQIRSWRRLKLLWDGFQRVWYSEVAHDWRIWDEQQDNDSNQQDYYNKPINVFRAYLESIIAALSINIPSVKCYPDDADSSLDILTAKAGDKIGELISRHNDVSLLWLHALYIYCTEGMVACYNYTKEDEKYGKFNLPKYEDQELNKTTSACPDCGTVLDERIDEAEENKYDPDNDDIAAQDALNNGQMLCPQCLAEIDPSYTVTKVIVPRIVGQTSQAKSRQLMEIYGGLYVKVANYAKVQKDTPYLIWSYETNYALARDRYKNIREQIQPGMGNPGEPYSKWGRNNPQYYGEMPTDSVTIRNTWLRPAAFEILQPDTCDRLKKKFPNGCKVVHVEQEFAEACNESLDDHWTLTNNPLSDFVYFDPIGLLLTSIQEITNDLTSLTLQTIEHGIPQTFADPDVLNFPGYSKMETTPGAIYPAKPKSGKSLNDAFYEVKTSTLSTEVLPFGNQIQQFGQLVSGATPSIFGGQLSGGSNTASEYSMSRSQALQRLQTTWKMFTFWWRDIYGKVIPAYIKCVQDQEDEKFVQKDSMGNFCNILIRKSELEGKIGSFEIETNENLPMTWSQRKDVLMKLLEANNPEILAMLAQPENLPLIYEMIGIADFYVPGEDDRNKQYDEIKQLLNSEPIEQPPPDDAVLMAISSDQPPPEPVEVPSVEIDPLIDNNAIEFSICQKWIVSPAGQLAKLENQKGYKNVLLHAIAHKMAMMSDEMHAASNANGAAPLAKPKQDKQAPITEDKDVKTS